MSTEKQMKKIILYGAFDRYNYGDNLMPVLMEIYLNRFHSDRIKNYNIVFASIKASDLTEFCCKKRYQLQAFLRLKKILF